MSSAVPDYRLTAGSPLIKAGTDPGDGYRTGLDPSSTSNVQSLARTAYDIGPYVYLAPKTGGNALMFSIP
jgi:hypothetical protein